MILYSNDRKLLRTLRDIQKIETNFLFISADYTFCVPIENPIRNMFSKPWNSNVSNSRLSRPKFKGHLFRLKIIFASITPVVIMSK